jgi:hypothetical protein
MKNQEMVVVVTAVELFLIRANKNNIIIDKNSMNAKTTK